MGLEELGEHELNDRLELLRHRTGDAVPALRGTRVQVIDRVQVVVFVVPAEGTTKIRGVGGRGGAKESIKNP